LNRKFSGGQHHKPATLASGEALDHGNAEGKRFPSAGLRNADNVFALNRNGYGLSLYGRWRNIPKPLQNFKQPGRYAKTME
jgi:hypothetical protein